VGSSAVLDCRWNRSQLRGSAAVRPVPFGGILSHPWDHVISMEKENYLNPMPSHNLAGISEEARKGRGPQDSA